MPRASELWALKHGASFMLRAALSGGKSIEELNRGGERRFSRRPDP